MDAPSRVRELVAAGEVDAAATACIEEVGSSVLGYLCALHDDDDAWDVFSLWEQDVWKGLPGFRFECSLRAWAFRLAWHASARFRRDPWRARGQRLGTSAASRLAASMRGTMSHPRDERLERLRRRLDEEELTLLVLRLDREMSWEEISAVLSEGGGAVSPETLRKRFERLKDKLAARAREEGLL